MALFSEQESQNRVSTPTVMQEMINSLSRVMRRLAGTFKFTTVTSDEFNESIKRLNRDVGESSKNIAELGEIVGENMASTNNEQLMSEFTDYSKLYVESNPIATTTSGNTGDWNITSDQWTYVTDDTNIVPWPQSEVAVAPVGVTTTVPSWVWNQPNFTHSQGDANMREVELLGTLSKITGLDFRSMLSLFTRVGSITKVQREKAIEQFSQAIIQYAVNDQFNVWQRAYAILLVRERNAGYFLFGEAIEPTESLKFEIHKINRDVGTVRKIRIGPFLSEEREKVEFHQIDPIVCPDTEYTIHLYSTDEDLYVRDSNFYRKKEN
jgi:hypothetical protein